MDKNNDLVIEDNFNKINSTTSNLKSFGLAVNDSLDTLTFDDIALLIISLIKKLKHDKEIKTKYSDIIKKDMNRTHIPKRAIDLFSQLFRAEYLQSNKCHKANNSKKNNTETNNTENSSTKEKSYNTNDSSQTTNMSNDKTNIENNKILVNDEENKIDKIEISNHDKNKVISKEDFVNFSIYNSNSHHSSISQNKLLDRVREEFMQILELYSIAIVEILNYNYYQGYNEILLNILMLVLNKEEFKTYYQNLGIYEACSLFRFFESKLSTITFLTQRISEFFLKDYLTNNFNFRQIEEIQNICICILIKEQNFSLSLKEIKDFMTEGLYFIYPWLLTLMNRLVSENLIMPLWDFLQLNHPLMIYVFIGNLILFNLNKFMIDKERNKGINKKRKEELKEKIHDLKTVRLGYIDKLEYYVTKKKKLDEERMKENTKIFPKLLT